MIVNSSRGGGSKDTWVLEERRPRHRPRRASTGLHRSCRPRCPTCATAAAGRARQQQQQQQRHGTAGAEAWLVRASPRSCSGWAATSRAPSTPRACSTASSRPTCRAGPTTRPACAWAGASILAIMGAPARRRAPCAATRSLRPLTLDRERARARSSPASPARARARARCATSSRPRCGRRSTPRTWRCGAATSRAALADGPLLRLPVRQGAQRAVLGADEPHDAARRGAARSWSPAAASSRPTWSCGCCASRCPPRARARHRRRARRPGARAAAGRRRLPGLPPRRARARRTPARSRASCSTSAPTRTPWPRRSTRCTTRCADADASPRSSEPVLRLSRLAADLEFRGRAAAEDGNLAEACELRAAGAGAGRRRHRRALLRRGAAPRPAPSARA